VYAIVILDFLGVDVHVSDRLEVTHRSNLCPGSTAKPSSKKHSCENQKNLGPNGFTVHKLHDLGLVKFFELFHLYNVKRQHCLMDKVLSLQHFQVFPQLLSQSTHYLRSCGKGITFENCN
jgi:hypothetical protein